jgi:hypothetical protein
MRTGCVQSAPQTLIVTPVAAFANVRRGPLEPLPGAMTHHPTPLLRTLRYTLAGLSAALLLAACASAPSSQDSLASAIAGPQRSDAAKARDVYRHPQGTLQFFEIAPTQTVLEIAPGGGWYTDILAPYLHDHGTLYEAEYESPSPDAAAEEKAGDGLSYSAS